MIITPENMETMMEERPENGNGKLLLKKLLPDAVKPSKLRTYACATLEPGAEVGYHVHTGESESYYILSGRGSYNDNGAIKTVMAGDCTFTPSGEGHGIRNVGSEPLVFIALIIRDSVA